MTFKPFAFKGHLKVDNRNELRAKQENLLIRVGRLMKMKRNGEWIKQKKIVDGKKKRTLYKLELIEKGIKNSADIGMLNRWEKKIQNHEDFIYLNNNPNVFFGKQI